jgi:uncharacterized protein
MKIAILGATGFVGPHLVQEALNRGHHVTAISRHPENLKITHVNLTTKKGDVFNTDELATLVKGHDVVLSAYNSGWRNPRIYEDYISAYESIQKAVKAAGIKRFLVIGGGGSLEVAPGVQLVDTPQFPAEYKRGAQAARDYLNIIKKEQDLEWTFFSPAILMHAGITDGRTGKFRLGTDQPVFDAKGESRLSVEDLSVTLLDEAENNKFIRKRFTAGY